MSNSDSVASPDNSNEIGPRIGRVTNLRRDTLVARVSFADGSKQLISITEQLLQQELVLNCSVLVEHGVIVKIISTPSLVAQSGIVRVIQTNKQGNIYGLIHVGLSRDIYLNPKTMTKDQASSLAVGAIVNFKIDPEASNLEVTVVDNISTPDHRAMKVTRAAEGTNARLFLCSSPLPLPKLDLSEQSALFSESQIGTMFDVRLANRGSSKGVRLVADLTKISSIPTASIESELAKDQSEYRERLLSLLAFAFAYDRSLVLRLVEEVGMNVTELRSVIVAALLESCKDSGIWNAFLSKFIALGFPCHRGGFWPAALEHADDNLKREKTLNAYLSFDFPSDRAAFHRLASICAAHERLIDILIDFYLTPPKRATRGVEEVSILMMLVAETNDEARFLRLVRGASTDEFYRHLPDDGRSYIIGAVASAAAELIPRRAHATDLVEACNSAFAVIGQCIEWKCFGALARFYGSYRNAAGLKALLELWPAMPKEPNWKSFVSAIYAAALIEDTALLHDIFERALTFKAVESNKDYTKFVFSAAEPLFAAELTNDAVKATLLALDCDLAFSERISALAMLWACSEVLISENPFEAEAINKIAREHYHRLLKSDLTEDEQLQALNCALVNAPNDPELLLREQVSPKFDQSLIVYSRLTEVQRHALRSRQEHANYIQELLRRDAPVESQVSEIANYIDAGDQLCVEHVRDSDRLGTAAARLNRMSGNFPEAERLLERLQRAGKVQNPALLAFEKGMLRLAQGGLDAAEAEFRESVAIKEHAASLNMLAKVLVQKGSLDEAIELLERPTEDNRPIHRQETLAQARWKLWQATGDTAQATASCDLLCEAALLEDNNYAASDSAISELCARLPNDAARDALHKVIDRFTSRATLRSVIKWERRLRTTIPGVMRSVKKRWHRDPEHLLSIGVHVDLARLAMRSAIDLYFRSPGYLPESVEFFKGIDPWKRHADREFLFECLVAQRGDVLKRMLRQYSTDCQELFAPILLDDDHALELIRSDQFNQSVLTLLDRNVPPAVWPENFRDRSIWSESDLLGRVEADLLVVLRSGWPSLPRSIQSNVRDDRFVSFADLVDVQNTLRRVFGVDSELIEFLGSVGLPTGLSFDFGDTVLTVQCNWLLVEEFVPSEIERKVRAALVDSKIVDWTLEQSDGDRIRINMRFQMHHLEAVSSPFDPFVAHLFQATRVFLREGVGQSFFRDVRAVYDACLRIGDEAMPDVEWSKVHYEILDQETAANADWLFRGESGSAHPRGAIHVLKNEIEIIQRGLSHSDLSKDLARLRKSIGNLQKSIIRIWRHELDLVNDQAATDIFEVLTEIANQHHEIKLVNEQSTPTWVFGDRLVIERVLANLIGNAIRHSNQLMRTVQIDLALNTPSKAVEIVIKNQFAPNAENAGGTGIGLVDVANLVQNALDGEFSWSIDGSTFTARMLLRSP